MKLGVSLPQYKTFDLGRDVVTAARAMEEIGFDSLWVFERILVPEDQSGPHGLYGVPGLPWPDRYRGVPDPLTVLTLAAAVTSRVELGTGVLAVPLHTPFRLARTLATLDAASGGRVVAGLGTGWSIDEFAAAAPRPFAERGRALDEFLDYAAAMWGPDPVTFSNDRYSLDAAEVGPKPVGHLPIVLAATAGRALARVARRADGWLATEMPPAEVGATLRRLRETAAENGRGPGAVDGYFQVALTGLDPVPEAGRRPYTGTFEQLLPDVAALAEAGVDHVYFTLPAVARDVTHLIDLAADLHAQLRAAGL
jgi:probable F420-dependent oxidoreductase